MEGISFIFPGVTSVGGELFSSRLLVKDVAAATTPAPPSAAAAARIVRLTQACTDKTFGFHRGIRDFFFL